MNGSRGRLRLAVYTAVATVLSLSVTDLCNADVNPRLHTGGLVHFDLRPETAFNFGPGFPIVPGGPAGGSEISLDPGVGFSSSTFVPGFCRSNCIAGWARNGVAAATQVYFRDIDVLPNNGFHAEFELHNRAGVPTTPFNIIAFDGWGNTYGGRTQLAAGQSLFLDLHYPDAIGALGSETGRNRIWASWRRLLAGSNDIGLEINAGELATTHPLQIFPWPVITLGPLNKNNHPFFNATGFRNDGEIDAFDGPIDPSLPTLSIYDPSDLTTYPDLFPDLGHLIPEPGTPGLLSVSMLLLSATRRRS